MDKLACDLVHDYCAVVLEGVSMDQTNRLDRLAHQMFRTYSRMEYALKAAGYLKSENGPAEAHWQNLASDIDARFQERVASDVELRQAVEYVLSFPPKKQMARDGVLEWVDVPPVANTETGKMLLYLARVRNNLFHGGKFNGRWLDPERSLELLPHSLTILECVRELSDAVQAAYDQ